MPPFSLFQNPLVRAALQQAWQDSQPGVSGGHEEGGFVVRAESGGIEVLRWPQGAQDTIALPPYASGKVGQKDILATFHTHPNTGGNYLQQPSETDQRAVRDDPGLKSSLYQGELIISQDEIYLVAPNGEFTSVGKTQAIFAGEAQSDDSGEK